MEKYQKHIIDTKESNKNGRKISLCKEDVSLDWCFQDIDHAIQNNLQKGRLQTCPRCIKVIIQALESNEDKNNTGHIVNRVIF